MTMHGQKSVSRTRNMMKDLKNNSKKAEKFYRELYEHTNLN